MSKQMFCHSVFTPNSRVSFNGYKCCSFLVWRFQFKTRRKVTLVYEAQGLKESLSFFVAAVNSKPILGLSACSKLNLVKIVESVSQAPCTKKEIVDNFADVFSGLGCMKGEYHIELDDGTFYKRNSLLSVRAKLFTDEIGRASCRERV